MRVVAMFRVSTLSQAEDGASLDAQERRFHELAKTSGWLSVGEFRGCESATQAATERHVLQQVMACIREQEPDALYVHEQSRLTRGDELEVALLFRELRERGIKVIVGGVVRDLSSIDERVMVSIQSVIDRAEAERIKERSRRGKREKARQGKKNNAGPAFGYVNPVRGDPRRGTLQIVPEQAVVVRRIFELAASGVGAYAIAKLLDAEGRHPPQAVRWGATSVRRILRNPVYLGIHATNVWVRKKGTRAHYLDLHNPEAIVVENAHEPIVSRDVWDAVHARLPLPRTAKPNMLTSLLWIQGERFAGDSANGKSYYRSSAEQQGHPWLQVEPTNQVVWDAFLAMAHEPRLVESIMAESHRQQPRETVTARVKEQQAAIAKLEARLNRLVDMRADGEISKDTYLEKASEVRQQLAAAETVRRQLQGRLAAADATHAERVVKAMHALMTGHTKFTDQQKRSILTSIVRRVDVSVHRSDWQQKRGKRGRFAVQIGPKWAIRQATFELVVPATDRIGCLDTPSRLLVFPMLRSRNRLSGCAPRCSTAATAIRSCASRSISPRPT